MLVSLDASNLRSRPFFPLPHHYMTSKRASSSSTDSPSTKKLAMSAPAVYPVTSFLVQRLSSKAQLPTRGSALAAGYDLYSYALFPFPLPSSCEPGGARSVGERELMHKRRAEAKTVPARGKALINTELSIAVPEGTYGRIAPRSGLGTSSHLRRRRWRKRRADAPQRASS